jgi:hypothetical protein
VVPPCGCQPIVERGHRGAHLFGGEKHATVGQLQPSSGAQRGQAQVGVDVQWHRAHTKLLNCRGGSIELPGAGRSHENLCQRDRACRKVLIGSIEEQLLRPVMVCVVAVEVGDEQARVEDDHSDQSWRSAAR